MLPLYTGDEGRQYDMEMGTGGGTVSAIDILGDNWCCDNCGHSEHIISTFELKDAFVGLPCE